ncbi:MAG: carbon-nitrogen family hydrolase [Oscillospiraceae bacterium]|nr:carbon-nitrogen family hydrolase [Oscillospiraceae bacterium]
MKVTCLQMQTPYRQPETNFAHAEELIRQAMAEKPDVIVLPETWNTGFYIKDGLDAYCDHDCQQVKTRIGALAAQFGVNIVAGSVSNIRDGKIYNTATVYDRTGACIASYDKTHLFTPMQEDRYYTPGNQLCTFTLDGVPCGLVICYDIRFPELVRSLTVPGLDMLFMVCQWPKIRTHHLRTLTTARAIENQMFLVCCNSCTPYGGHSAIIDPWGETLALAGEAEDTITAECNMQILSEIRSSIPVFRDRRPDVYKL